jgi:hypothetical protein
MAASFSFVVCRPQFSLGVFTVMHGFGLRLVEQSPYRRGLVVPPDDIQHTSAPTRRAVQSHPMGLSTDTLP